jgi:hypothetical protein
LSVLIFLICNEIYASEFSLDLRRNHCPYLSTKNISLLLTPESKVSEPHGGNASVKIKEAIMKIVVIGGTGLIGSKLVPKLREQGHETVAASPNSGV